MAVSSICLPGPIQHEDARSWFKRFKFCAAATKWDAAKQLLCPPTLLKGWSWAIYESLGEAEKKSYDKLKKAILNWLDSDVDEHRLAQLSQRSLHKGLEGIDELARDLKKLLDQDFLQQHVRWSYTSTWSIHFQTMWHFN